MTVFERVISKPGYKLLFVAGLFLAAGYVESQEPAPVPEPVVVKTAAQEQIETLLPAHIAKPIAERSAYPRTMAAIAHTESRGDHHAVGDHGKARGLFQVWPSLHGSVPDSIEGQVDQANVLFLSLVKEHGYRKAVALWNGSPSNPKVKAYQRVVLAKVAGLER